jgi:shikimate 5-dehydrogenase
MIASCPSRQPEPSLQRLLIGQSFAHSAVEAAAAAFEATGSADRDRALGAQAAPAAGGRHRVPARALRGALIALPTRSGRPRQDQFDDAKAERRANVVVRGGRLRGHNTDVVGVRRLSAILRTSSKWPARRSCSGPAAGRGGGRGPHRRGFQRIAVFNHHLHKAEAVVAHFRA